LSTCKTEALLKVGGTFPEIAAHEKVIDGFVELVKRDQLDENVPTETLEKCVGYFNTLFPVLLGPENRLNHTQLLVDNVKSLVSACDGFTTDSMVIRNLIEVCFRHDIYFRH
jgi:dynactin 1